MKKDKLLEKVLRQFAKDVEKIKKDFPIPGAKKK